MSEETDHRFRVFAMWDMACWIIAGFLSPADLAFLRRSLLDDPSYVRDAGMSLGLDRTSVNPPQYRRSQIDRRGAA